MGKKIKAGGPLGKLIDDLPEGWSAELTRKNHIRITGPDGKSVTCASSTGDHRAVHNTRSRLRRIGCPV